jgi:hypothetical protein
LKVLLRKNAISYRRTLFGSLIEIVFPLIVFSLLCLMRYSLPVTVLSDEFKIQDLKTAFYPVTQLNTLTDTWESSNYQVTQTGIDLVPLMQHADYIALLETEDTGDGNTTKLFNPFLDFMGPLYLFPSNCWSNELMYHSSAIAYIKQGNQIERDVVDQLQLMFQRMKDAKEIVTSLVAIAQADQVTDEDIELMRRLFLDGGTDE